MARPPFAALALALLCSAPALADEKPPPSVRCLAFSPDGKALAAGLVEGDTGALVVRDATKPAVKWRQAQPAGVRAVSFLPGGKALAAAVGPSLLLIDSTTGKTIKTLGKHGKPITSLALTADGKMLASGGEDGAIKLWGVAAGVEVRELRQGGAVLSLSFAPDGKRLLVAAGSEAALWDVRSGKKSATLKPSFLHVSCVAFLPDGKEAFTGSNDGTARLWDVGKEVQKMFLEGVGGLRGLCYEPRTKTLALWGAFGSVGLFAFDRQADEATSKRIAVLIDQLDVDDFDKREAAESALLKIGFPAESALREARSAKSAEVRIRARRALQTLLGRPVVKIDVKARAVAFSPGGQALAVGGEGFIRLYDPKTGKALADAASEVPSGQ
jgi:hypothetical protein